MNNHMGKMVITKRILVLGIVFVFALNIAYSQTITQWMGSAQTRIDTLRKGNFSIKVFDSYGNIVNDSVSLKLKKHEFVFGCANDFLNSNYNSDPTIPSNNDWIKANMLKYFNFNVTGNAYKWSGTQPSNASTYNYGPVDSVVKWNERSGLNNIKGHTLIWGAYNDSDYHCIPKWVMDLPTKADIYNACETRVRSMVKKYKGKFKDIDVLNEPLNALWLKNKLGSDSIYWNMFKWARQEDPTAKLYINDYNVEYSWGKANEYKDLIKKMLSKGAPIDGIGIQAHFWSGDINLADLKKNVDTLASIGLPLKFTEFDLESMTQSRQAYNTGNAYRFAFSHPAFNGIISWGFWDAGAWRENSGYFDINKNPKIAVDTINKLVNQVWTTKINTKITSNILTFKAYYGRYEVKAKFGNTWKQFYIDCNKLYKDSVFEIREQEGITVKPQFVSAKLISKNRILVKFDKKMNNPQSNIRAFKIFQVNPIKIDSISVLATDSTTIAIKLVSDVNNNFISVFYSDGNLTSSDGGVLEAFGPEKITNNFVALDYAVTTNIGKSIEAKFNRPMADPSSHLSSFKILKNNAEILIDSVRLKTGNDSVLVFSLASSVKGGDTLLMHYFAGTLKSKSGLELASFYNFNITNNLPRFLLVSAGTSFGGNTIDAKFNMPISISTVQASSFSILIGAASYGVDSAKLNISNDSILTLYLSRPVKLAESPKLTHVACGTTSTDGYELASFSNFTVKNNVTLLALQSVGTSKDGKSIYVVLNKPMADPSAQLSAFRIYYTGTTTLLPLDSIRLKSGNDSIFVITLRNAAKSSDALQFFYYPGTVSATDGQKLGLLRFINITNNVVTGMINANAGETLLFPNPAKDFIFVKSKSRITKICLYNQAGKLIIEKFPHGYQAQINISELPEGAYLVTAYSDNSLIFSSKFVKN